LLATSVFSVATKNQFRLTGEKEFAMMKNKLSNVLNATQFEAAVLKSIRGLMLVLCCATLVTVGCARPAEVSTSVEKQTESQSTIQAAATDQQIDNQDSTGEAAYPTQLIGAWLGEAYLDEVTFEQKFQTIPAERQQAVLNSARTFLTTAMAIEFRPDGSIENEMELTPIGSKAIREGSVGSWRAVEVNENQILIETTTQLADGTIATNSQLFHVYPEGNRLALEVNLPAELGECSPMIILNRQPSPDTNVAELPSGVTTK
jgi:hypothetical protein